MRQQKLKLNQLIVSLQEKYHPDVNKTKEAEEKFKDINEAYEVLGDKQKRQRYDSLGSSWQGGADYTPPPGFENFNFNFNQGGAQSFDFGGGAGGFSDFFSSLFWRYDVRAARRI